MANCAHLLCSNPAEPYEPMPGAPIQYWCDEHAHLGGFCSRCGSFEAANWEWIQDPNHWCLSCQEDFKREENSEEIDDQDYWDNIP